MSVSAAKMDKKVMQSLIMARKSVRKKFMDMQNDISRSENVLERKFKPIADPLKALLKSVKTEPYNVKKENDESKFFLPPIHTSSPLRRQEFPSTTELTDTPKRIAKPSPRPLREEFRDIHRAVDSSTDTNDSDEPRESAEVMIQQLQESKPFQDYLTSFGGNAKVYVGEYMTDIKKDFDYVYGPKREINTDKNGREYDTGRFLLGKSYIDFSDDGNIIYITTPDGVKKPYKGSVALYELIFKSVPTKASVENNVEAVKDYKDILNKTNVHRIGYEADKQIKGNSGRKYLEYIKPILALQFSEKNIRQNELLRSQSIRPRTQSIPAYLRKGQGVLQFTEKKVQYVPYKTANQLVNRLRVLIASQLAGHTGLDNEIVYVIDELRRIKIIK